MDLKEILALPESERLERTSSLNDKAKICKNITAFANDLANSGEKGYFIIGIDDKTLNRVGLKITDQDKLKISGYLQEGKILPIPSVNFIYDIDPSGDVLILEVSPSSEPPVRFDGTIYVRLGPSVAKASREDERRLIEKNIWANGPYEIHPCRLASIRDLETLPFLQTYLPSAFSHESLEENDRTLEERLASLQLWNPSNNCPTYLGLLAFGINPTAYIPGAYVQYIVFEGTSDTSYVLSSKEISGDIYTIIKQLEPLLEGLTISHPSEEIGFAQIRKPTYPYKALRELVLNAILHRDYQVNAPIKIYVYADRILIENPGGYSGKNTDPLPLKNLNYRNPALGGILKDYGYVEKFGRGISLSLKRCEENGNEIKFDYADPNYFSVTIYVNTPITPAKNKFYTLSFFNNKGGVGKTTLLYHLAWMFFKLGKKVLVVDLDPQSNTTGMFLDESRLEEIWESNDTDTARNIYQALNPIEKGTGDILPIQPVEIQQDEEAVLYLIPGHLGLARFEDRLSSAWSETADGREDAFRVISALHRIIQQTASQVKADLVLVDVAPNLGALNRCALIASDYYIIPMAPDLFSLQGLKNLGPTLKEWGKQWKRRLVLAEEEKLSFVKELPEGSMRPLGYVLMQYTTRSTKPVKAYEKWVERIPNAYRMYVLGQYDEYNKQDYCLGLIKNYQSLMPMAQEARKPIFLLRASDGVIGSHVKMVESVYRDFEILATTILETSQK